MTKKFEISGLEMSSPSKYQPEWLKRGIVPFEVDTERLRQTITQGNVNMNKNMELRQRYPAKVIPDEDAPKIKNAPVMAKPDEAMWYDDDAAVKPEDIIDNNDVVNNDKIQRFEVKSPVKQTTTSVVDKIREKFSEKPTKPEEKARIAQPGEFVLMIDNKVIEIGKLEEVKTACEEEIMKREFDIKDEDILIFLRVPLDKVFK